MISTPGDSTRRGMSTPELLTVISVIVILAGMTMTAVQAVVRTQRMVAAVSSVEQVARTARDLAKRAVVINSIPDARDPDFSGKCYGLVIDASGSRPWVGLTWSTRCDGSADLALDQEGEPFLRKDLPASVRIWRIADDGTATPISGTVGWMYRHRSGGTVARSGTAAPGAYIGGGADLGSAAATGELERILPGLAIGEDPTRLVPIRLLPSGALITEQH